MPTVNPLKRFFGEPLVQFLLIGGCIYGAFAIFGASEEEASNNQVHVDSARIGSMISQWESRWKRKPTREEIEGLIDSYVKEEVLYRQAVTMGLGEDDPITRRRMAQKLEFLMSDLASAVQPEEGALEKYYAENEATYREPDRVTFVQVFFNPDERKGSAVDDAKAELERLSAAGKPDLTTLKAGDRSMVREHFTAVDQVGISRDMGREFAESVMALESGQWHGPVLSGYGVHLVYIFETEKGELPDLATVKEKVLEDLNEEQRKKFNANFLEGLKDRFEIVIDELPTERLINMNGPSEAKEKKTSDPTAE